MTVAPADRAVDARLAILVLAAEEMYDAQGPKAVEPVLDPRIEANWNLRGYVTGTDAIFRMLGRWALGEQQVFYGLVLESKATPGRFALLIRGTAGTVEWGEDVEGLPTVARFPGLVEAGFVGIGDTFKHRLPGGSDLPLVATITDLVGAGTLVVAGHSLGSALATYAAYEMAMRLPAGRVSLRVFASPHPGNSVFTQAVAAVVPDHAHYKNPHDIVPSVPISLGYAHLPNTIELAPATDALEIEDTWGCSHHLLSYIALLDATALSEAYSPQNQPYLPCIVSRTAQSS